MSLSADLSGRSGVRFLFVDIDSANEYGAIIFIGVPLNAPSCGILEKFAIDGEQAQGSLFHLTELIDQDLHGYPAEYSLFVHIRGYRRYLCHGIPGFKARKYNSGILRNGCSVAG